MTPHSISAWNSSLNEEEKLLSLSMPLVPPVPTAPLDLFAQLLAHKLRYLPGESDSVILSHEIISRPVSSHVSDSRDDLVHASTLLLRQPDPTASAMAVTVALPVSIAAMRILDGHVKIRGVIGPTADKEIYQPVLEELSRLGIVMKESTKSRRPGIGLAGSMMDSRLFEQSVPRPKRAHA